MSDDTQVNPSGTPDNVVSLADRRAEQAGSCFHFTHIHPDEYHLGHTEDGFVVLHEKTSLEGYMLSAAEALELAIQLIQVCGDIERERLPNNDEV